MIGDVQGGKLAQVGACRAKNAQPAGGACGDGAGRVEVWLGCRRFVASTAFHGRRRGYYFGTGEGGTGYYLFPLRERLAAGRIYGL